MGSESFLSGFERSFPLRKPIIEEKELNKEFCSESMILNKRENNTFLLRYKTGLYRELDRRSGHTPC